MEYDEFQFNWHVYIGRADIEDDILPYQDDYHYDYCWTDVDSDDLVWIEETTETDDEYDWEW